MKIFCSLFFILEVHEALPSEMIVKGWAETVELISNGNIRCGDVFSLRTGSLVPRTGEARKSEPARELLMFEFRPSRGVKSAFHMCQII